MVPHKLLLLVAFLANGDPYRCALQAEYFTNLVFQIPLIREVEQPSIITENNKVRGLCACLGHIVNLQSAALVRGGLHTSSSLCQNAIQGAGGNTAGVLLVDFLNYIAEVAILRAVGDNKGAMQTMKRYMNDFSNREPYIATCYDFAMIWHAYRISGLFTDQPMSFFIN